MSSYYFQIHVVVRNLVKGEGQQGTAADSKGQNFRGDSREAVRMK